MLLLRVLGVDWGEIFQNFKNGVSTTRWAGTGRTHACKHVHADRTPN